jgi:hypothetical protein
MAIIPDARRACSVCGAGMRADAVVCSASCRAEASRLRRLLSGTDADGYRSLTERLGARRRRTSTMTMALAERPALRSADVFVRPAEEDVT